MSKMIGENKQKRKEMEARAAAAQAFDAESPVAIAVQLDKENQDDYEMADDFIDEALKNNRKEKGAGGPPVDLVSYNHVARSKFRKLPHIKISEPIQHAFMEFTLDVEHVKKLEKSASEDLQTWKDTVAKTYGLEVHGGNAVTVSWMLNLEGPNVMDVSATVIRDAVVNRRDEILQYIREKVGVNVDGKGVDVFALDWKDVSKKVFNDYRCIFPIYFPGMCIKLSRKGAHITGPTKVEEFLGIAELVRGLYTLVSKDDRPHYCKSFSMSMLNVPIKLSTIDKKLTFPKRDAIHRALDNALQDADRRQVGFLWDNTSTFHRVCIQELKFVPAKYAGVNFRYFVHGEKLPGDIGLKSLKWPWVTLFDKGTFSIINHSPKHIVKTIKFVVEFMAGILVAAPKVAEDDDDDEEDEANDHEIDEDNEDDDHIHQLLYDEDNEW
jgi:hypothetical protein